MSEKKLSRVEQLLKDAETTKNETLKSALEKHAEKEREREERRLLAQFTSATNIRDDAVEKLRCIRKEESEQKKIVEKIDAAVEKFKKDGNYREFMKVCDSLY